MPALAGRLPKYVLHMTIEASGLKCDKSTNDTNNGKTPGQRDKNSGKGGGWANQKTANAAMKMNEQ